jgi:CDP-glycerol glycerophosphotransferase (TagB/SpsB family)
MVKAVCVAVSSLPGAQLLIRPYPREDESVFRRLAAEYGNVFVDNRKIPLYDALGVADAVLTEISSVATEAVAMSKPLGIVNFTGRPFPTEPYPRVHIESGVALAITRESDLLPALKNLLYGSLTRQQLSRSRATFVRDQLYRMDGKSAERVARLIERAGRRK